jgi:hypothetical protein
VEDAARIVAIDAGLPPATLLDEDDRVEETRLS